MKHNMEIGKCQVLYLDRRTRVSTLVAKDDLASFLAHDDFTSVGTPVDRQIVKQNLESILGIFNDVYLCADGQACLKRLAQYEETPPQVPTILLIDVPDNDESHIVSPLTSNPVVRVPGIEKKEPSDLYGEHMLSHICSSIQQRSMSRLIMPVAVTVNSEAARAALEEEPSLWALSKCSPDAVRGIRYLDIGAADVLTSPLSSDRVHGLTVHAYRIFKDHLKEDTSSLLTKRNRKLSWIGVEEERPFAYLREAMVSGLMVGICNPETINDAFDPTDLKLEEARIGIVENAVGQWSFSAHDFTSDELVHAARVILRHALQAEELRKWSLSLDELTIFVMACRKNYNDFVLYHNFRHVVDVLQAIFLFLLRIGLLPPYQVAGNPVAKPSNAVAAVLQPFDGLTLLVAALGHDVGHPGVNNAFLVALNAPLAQLYNDKSVLEAFHCAAYSQILRRYWPSAFGDIRMRKLMISSILATDMSLHFKYMTEMSSLQEKIAAAQSTADGWVPKVTDETRDLVCGLLIKCADISNVARKYACAAQWARVLTEEFANQGAMEKDLNLPTCLFGGPPDPNDFLKLAESQLGFMNIFARPLFEGVSAVLPEMRFTLAELAANKAIWLERIEAENSRKMSFIRGPLSPLARSTATPSETDSVDQRERLSPNPSDPETSSGPRSPTKADGQSQTSAVQQAIESNTLEPLDENGVITTPITTLHTPVAEIADLHDRRHSSVYSNVEDDAKLTPRRGSHDATLATTIYVQTRTSPAAQNMLDLSAPASPVKYELDSGNGAKSKESRLPPAERKVSSNTAFQISDESPTYIHTNKSEEFSIVKTAPMDFSGVKKLQTMSVYGADVLAKATATSSKHTMTSHVTPGTSEDSPSTDSPPDLRSMRSRSTLRSLQFWKKKPAKSDDFETTEQVS